MMANQVVDNRHGEAKRVLCLSHTVALITKPKGLFTDCLTNKLTRTLDTEPPYVTSAHPFVSIILCPVLYILVFILCIHTCIAHSMCQDFHFITFIVFKYILLLSS